MPFFSNWIGSTTGASTSVVTSPTLGGLFGGTTATTNPTPIYYATNALMAQQTATATQAGLAQQRALIAMTRANSHLWYANSSNDLNDWTLLSNTATTTSTNWALWEDELNHTQYIALAQQRVVQTRVRTEEERARDEARRAQVQADQLRLAQERAAALQRSRELLLAHLTAKQRETFEANKWFVVAGGKSKQLYRINDKGSYSANIEVLAGRPGKTTHRLCCHLADYRVPLYDHLLAQKVWIEHDEDAFLRQANRHAA